MLEIYKPTQGKYTRISTFVAVMAIVVSGAYVLSNRIDTNMYVRYGIPTAIVVLTAALMYWVVNRPRSADFMIATEGEMKKVSWSSRKEVIGSTKVVIITAAILATLLFVVDIVLVMFFKALGVTGY